MKFRSGKLTLTIEEQLQQKSYETLDNLECSYNRLTSLPELPLTFQTLDCSVSRWEQFRRWWWGRVQTPEEAFKWILQPR